MPFNAILHSISKVPPVQPTAAQQSTICCLPSTKRRCQPVLQVTRRSIIQQPEYFNHMQYVNLTSDRPGCSQAAGIPATATRVLPPRIQHPYKRAMDKQTTGLQWSVITHSPWQLSGWATGTNLSSLPRLCMCCMATSALCLQHRHTGPLKATEPGQCHSEWWSQALASAGPEPYVPHPDLPCAL